MAYPADSTFKLILKSVQDTIVNLQLPGGPDVKRRKKPLVAHDDTLPIILVVPQKETVFLIDTAGGLLVDYPVLVTIAFKGDELLERNIDLLLDWRHAIRQSLNTTHLHNVANVIDCQIELNPPFDPQYYQAQFDVSAIKFTFRAKDSWDK
jgi:hypothetical protein